MQRKGKFLFSYIYILIFLLYYIITKFLVSYYIVDMNQSFLLLTRDGKECLLILCMLQATILILNLIIVQIFIPIWLLSEVCMNVFQKLFQTNMKMKRLICKWMCLSMQEDYLDLKMLF